jgi:DNA repair exonuclease SbcCD ATPase subunit
MSKPVESESIANENAAEEKEVVVISEEEVNAPVVEDVVVEVAENVAEVAGDVAKADAPDVEANVAEADTPEVEEIVVEADKPAVSETDKLSKEEIVERLALAVEKEVSDAVKNEVDALKQSFYKLKRIETDAAKKAFTEAGGIEEDFAAEEDAIEDKLKDLLTVFREKRASIVAEAEKIKEENLVAKKNIIEQLKELIESQDDFYKVYNEFKKLQQQWKEIKQIPQSAVNDLWKEYQHYSEKFYDLLKINNEMRDYDFKKNQELKLSLCEAVERLDEEKDVISAFYQLQKLHQEWREVGPVARELREEIWARFKKASSVINKKHQEHFDDLRGLEQRNLEEKTALCEEMEAIDYSLLSTFKEWDEKNKRVLELQDKWKTIGFAPKKQNVKIFERFRGACDVFFQKKSDFYKGIKETMDVNLEKKKTLCEKAEALKESQEWKEVTDKLIALQKEWKTIGPVSRKYSDAIWKRFISACDHFFEQKNTHFSSQKTEEVENLKKKKDIIANINAIDEALPANEAIAQLREYMAQFNNVGFVPFRDKDKIYKEYRTAVDKHFDRLKIDESERRLQSFKSNLNDIGHSGEKSKNKLLNERDKLMRNYERLKSDIQTYENNIGFLSVSSKGGGGLVKEMQRKIESLKDELDLIEKKIEVIDQSLGFEN